jgi:hypothetical protein
LEVSKSLTLEKLSVVLLPKYIPSLETQPFGPAPLEQTPSQVKTAFSAIFDFCVSDFGFCFTSKEHFPLYKFYD